MKRIVLIITLASTTIFACSVFSQVRIGDLNTPDQSAVLELVSPSNNFMGLLIPRMTEAERNNIKNPANGLLIFNIDEGCINSYDFINDQWSSLCGGVRKSVFTSLCNDINFSGAYVEKTPLNNSNYMTVSVNVAKIGAYSISATTENGYGFHSSGTFLNTGAQQVILVGQGTPEKISDPGNEVTLVCNGVSGICTSVVIPVLPAISTYTMNCGNAKIFGVYQLGTPMNNSNYMTLPIIVDDISKGGSWSITSNTVNGISFKGYGVFTSIGAQEVTLYASGTPNSTATANFTLTSNSYGEVEMTCRVSVTMAVPTKTILGVGDTFYNVSNNYAPNKLMSADINFGTYPNSTVKFVKPFKFITASGESAIRTALSSSNPPDILITGYPFGALTGLVPDFINYLNKGGVVILYCQDNNFVQSLMRIIFGDNSISSQNGGGAGSRYMFPILNDDPIINGPFGNLGGKYWGEDASITTTLPALVSNPNITVYSTSPADGSVSAFRHNSLNLVFVGDGGFNACCGTSLIAYPFAVDSNNIPQEKANYGPGSFSSTNGSGPVANSIFFANALAWAINVSQSKGINTK